MKYVSQIRALTWRTNNGKKHCWKQVEKSKSILFAKMVGTRASPKQLAGQGLNSRAEEVGLGSKYTCRVNHRQPSTYIDQTKAKHPEIQTRNALQSTRRSRQRSHATPASCLSFGYSGEFSSSASHPSLPKYCMLCHKIHRSRFLCHPSTTLALSIGIGSIRLCLHTTHRTRAEV